MISLIVAMCVVLSIAAAGQAVRKDASNFDKVLFTGASIMYILIIVYCKAVLL